MRPGISGQLFGDAIATDTSPQGKRPLRQHATVRAMTKRQSPGARLANRVLAHVVVHRMHAPAGLRQDSDNGSHVVTSTGSEGAQVPFCATDCQGQHERVRLLPG
jgi:hypothetical protein